MKTLLNGMKRWSPGADNPIAGRIDAATRSRRTVREAPRARLGLECLETRDLMSGLAATPLVSGAAPAPSSPGTPPAVSLTATAVSPTEINLVWLDDITGTSGFSVYELTGGQWKGIIHQGGDAESYTVSGLSPDSAYDFYVAIASAPDGDTGKINFQDSNMASATTFLPLAGSPSLSVTAASSTKVNLAWTSVSGRSSTP